MNSGRILVNGSSFYCGNSTSNLCQLALKTDVPAQYVHPNTKQCNYSYTHPSTIQCNAATEINSLKSSVSSGKTQVANAITGKGVSASGNDTFATLVSKINQIKMNNGVRFTVQSGSKGEYFLPTFGFRPQFWISVGKRQFDEADWTTGVMIDFNFGFAEAWYIASLDGNSPSTRAPQYWPDIDNGWGHGFKFNPASYASQPNVAGNALSLLNPNNYVSGTIEVDCCPTTGYHEYSVYEIFAVPE